MDSSVCLRPVIAILILFRLSSVYILIFGRLRNAKEMWYGLECAIDSFLLVSLDDEMPLFHVGVPFFFSDIFLLVSSVCLLPKKGFFVPLKALESFFLVSSLSFFPLF